MPDESGNLYGTRVEPPKGPGSFVGRKFRDIVVSAINIVRNHRYFFLLYDSSGNYIGRREAETKMGPLGATTTFNFRDIPAGGSLELTDGTTDLNSVTKIIVAGATVGGAPSAATLTINFGSRYYNGVGAPSAATLPTGVTFISASSMISPGGPDFYFDVTNPASPDMYVCITAGDKLSSVWMCLTCC